MVVDQFGVKKPAFLALHLLRASDYIYTEWRFDTSRASSSQADLYRESFFEHRLTVFSHPGVAGTGDEMAGV
jgi:hypothetical protein